MLNPPYIKGWHNRNARLWLLLSSDYLLYFRAHHNFFFLLFSLPLIIAARQLAFSFLPTTVLYAAFFHWLLIYIWFFQIVHRIARHSAILKQLYPLGTGVSLPTYLFGVREKLSLLVIEPLLALGFAVINLGALHTIYPMSPPYFMVFLFHYYPEYETAMMRICEGIWRDYPVIQQQAYWIAAGWPFLAALALYLHNRYQYAATEEGMEEAAAKAPAQPYASGPKLTFAYGRRQKHRGFRSASAKDLSKGLGDD